MHDPADFDAFYAAARERLLLQTYALTGDLPAARGAVRDAFVAAWHHWRKVSRLEDPEAWVRPHAWSHAQRRHTARIWHRDKDLDDESRATLDALAKLSVNQRKVLLLSNLGSTSMSAMSREVGLPDEVAARELQSATSGFAVHRDVPSTAVRRHVEGLSTRTDTVRFPRATIIRRAGAARRRAHTSAGVLAVVAVLIGAGTLVGTTTGASPQLNGVSAHGAKTDRDREPEPLPHLDVDQLLTKEQLSPVVGDRRITKVNTGDNTQGNGINVACQRDRFADPAGVGALVRRFKMQGKPDLGALQTVELSNNEQAAKRAYRRTVAWFAGCRDIRAQLRQTHDVGGVGDEASLLVLRTWNDPVTTYTVGVARTGSLTNTVVRRLADDSEPKIKPMVRLLGSSVTDLCQHEDAGACTTTPKATPAPPPPARGAHGFLQVIDLPPITDVARPWLATRPIEPKVNAAATRCDNADFTVKPITFARTRSFVIPQAKLPNSFGLTETVGRFGGGKQARNFVAAIRDRMAGCDDKDLATTLNQVHHEESKRSDLSIWRVTTEVSDEKTVEFLMAIARRKQVVLQLGFVPAPHHTMGEAAFQELTARAMERVDTLPMPGKKAPGRN